MIEEMNLTEFSEEEVNEETGVALGDEIDLQIDPEEGDDAE